MSNPFCTQVPESAYLPPAPVLWLLVAGSLAAAIAGDIAAVIRAAAPQIGGYLIVLSVLTATLLLILSGMWLQVFGGVE